LTLLLITTDSVRLVSELLKFGQSIPSILAKPVRLDVLQSLVEQQIQGARILAA
jgi:hypothetical protein